MSTKAIACAIVKDEPRIRETVANLRDVMGEALAGVLIHETGGNAENSNRAVLACDWFHSREFDDFSSARNACLDHAERIARTLGAEWLFMFSGGAKFSGAFKAPLELPAPAPALAHTERLGAAEYVKCTTVRVGSGLRYVGKTHEVIDVGVEALPNCGLTVDYTDDWDIEKKRKRWALDVDLLRGDYSARGRFYLAQSYELLGQRVEAFWHYAERLAHLVHVRERRQAAVGAVRVAPSMALAVWAANESPSADGYLVLAERYELARDTISAKSYALIALHTEERSMFARVDLVDRCKEILGK